MEHDQSRHQNTDKWNESISQNKINLYWRLQGAEGGGRVEIGGRITVIRGEEGGSRENVESGVVRDRFWES